MVDAVTVWDDAATANLTLNGTSAGMYLTGFNTGGTFDYHNIESIEFFLGNNGNHLNVTATWSRIRSRAPSSRPPQSSIWGTATITSP